MNKLSLIAALVLIASPVLAAPTIKFAQTSGSFDYDSGTQIFTFHQTIDITHGLGNSSDALAVSGAYIEIPDLVVSGLYVSPLTSTTLKITDGSTNYLTGTLGTGSIVDGGEGVLLYTTTINDITSVQINQTTPPSLALTAIQNMLNGGGSSLNLSVALSDSSVNSILLEGSQGGEVGGTINIIIPTPGAILLGGIGVTLVGWMRRRRTL